MRPYRPRHCAGGKRFVTFLAQMLDHCTSVVHATGEYSRGGFGERPNAHAAQFG
jgi:hypothetical protein